MCLWTGAAEAAGRPVLRVGLTYIAQDEASGTGHPQFDKTVTDYMQVLASYAGMDVQYVPDSVQGNIDALLDGRVDVLPDLVITPERAGYQSPVLDKVLAMEQRPYTLAEYSTPMALEDAYRAGKIDGFEVNAWPLGPEEPAAAYDVTTTHLAVKKGNTDLLNRLNAAADRLMLARPTSA